MRRLRVLFITPWYPTTVDPVAGVFIREHARAVQLYNDVVVVHAVGSRRDLHRPWQMEQDTDTAVCQGIPTYHVWARRPAGLPAAYLHRAWAVQQACQLIIKNGFQPDIIHAHISAMGLPAALVARRHRLPMVISEHASTFPRREMTPLNLLIAKLAFGSAHRVLPVSRFLQQAIEAYGIRARFEIVPNVVDTEIFQPLGGSSAPGEVKHILFVGSMGTDRVKGLAFLLQALATLKQTNWHLDLIGDGPCRADYMQLAQELGIQTRLTFHGQKTKAELAEHMRRCDFLVSSSLIETFGIVLLEALASGRPVVATDSGGPGEFLTQSLGNLVPPGDPGALALAIENMLIHSAEYPPARLAEYVRQRFSPQKIGLALDEIYRELVAKI